MVTIRESEIWCECCDRTPGETPEGLLVLYNVTWDLGDSSGFPELGASTALLCQECADNPADGIILTPRIVT